MISSLLGRLCSTMWQCMRMYSLLAQVIPRIQMIQNMMIGLLAEHIVSALNAEILESFCIDDLTFSFLGMQHL